MDRVRPVDWLFETSGELRTASPTVPLAFPTLKASSTNRGREMAQELLLRDTSRSYGLRETSTPSLAISAATAHGRCASAHAMLAKVLAGIRQERLAGRPQPGCPAGSGRMHCTRLCFSTQKLPPSKHAELDRQLAGQQQGLNALTVQEYLSARSGFDPAGRDPNVARRARASWRDKLTRERNQSLREAGCDATVAQDRAKAYASRKMRGLHALHNPDRIAGGHDVISDFGDGQVNSTIGRQWNVARRGELSRVQQLDSAARCVPEHIRAHIRMNGLLTRDA